MSESKLTWETRFKDGEKLICGIASDKGEEFILCASVEDDSSLEFHKKLIQNKMSIKLGWS